MKYYVLDGHEAAATDDLQEWARLYEDNDLRRVANDTIGEADVSTVFLGLDHNWGGGPPLLFETMIFGGPHDDAQWRWHTWDEAELGHRRIVTALRAGHDPQDAV